MTARILLLIATLCIATACHAQAYKCKMPDGKFVISNEGCANGGKLEQITTAPVTYDRWRQAAEVNARNNKQLDGIARENASFNAQLRRQQAAQAVIDQQHAAEQARNDSLDRHKRCLEEANRYRDKAQARMIAACNGVPYYDDEPQQPPVQEAANPSPLPVIKSCNGNSCNDQMGNRYTETAGKITNSQGQRCYRSGKVMYCD